MFFYLSKILFLPAQPSNALMILLIGSALLMWRGVWLRAAKRGLALAVIGLVVCGVLPTGYMLVLPLEQRFPRPELPKDVDAIIMLGGFEVPSISKVRGEMAVNEAAERLLEGVRLARLVPQAKLVFTGGDGQLFPSSGSAAPSIGQWLEQMGVARERIVLEDVSRTTWENALMVKPLLAPAAGKRYLLVTSAWHMPRSMGVFRKVGFDVIAWPVDYRTRGPGDAIGLADSIGSGLNRVDFATKEWVGLVGYRVTGRTSALWPAP